MKNTNSMSILLKSLGLFLLLFVVVLSCKKEEDPVPEKQKANFEFANATVSEDVGGTAQVNINLEKATVEAGTLTVSITNGTDVAYTTNYVTNPNGSSGSFEIAIAKGATTASFTITPVDDAEENDARVITFTLTEATGGVELGDKKTLELSIIDNDTPAAVNFELATGTVAENVASALTVNLTLTSAAVNAGTFDVAYTSSDAVYTTDFTTDPDGASGTFTVNVDAGATTATFTVMPVDNADLAADKTVTFTISNTTGGINLGQATTHALTIEDDDDNSTIAKTIAEIKALYDGSANVDITEEWAIIGTVTSKNDAVNERNLFIQDATGGIAVRWSEAHSFTQGDELTILIQGATISDFNDLVQITGTLPITNGTVNSQGNSVTPEVITFTQLNSGDFQGKLITVGNVTFPAANGIEEFSGNNDISDGSITALVRVESGAGFSSDVLPLGMGDITGIAGVFQGTAQILPQERADVFANDPASAIVVTQSLIDFGNVDSNTSSASQSYTVSGTSLTEDIVVTAPNQFEVSLDDATFASTVNILAADAMAGDVTVYARFSPTAGTGGAFAGDISHTTAGAVAVTFGVTGTEILANPPLFSETFETDGNGTRYTTSIVEFSDGGMDYFIRTDGSTIGSSIEFTGVTGSYFAVMDVDAANAGGSGGPTSATMDFTGIDISGKTNLQFAISIAEDDDGANQDWDDDTELSIEYQIDGGGYQNLLAVQAKELRDDGSADGSNKAPAIDTNFDGTGDGVEISAAFTEFTSAIAGTGTTLDIRVNFNVLNAGDEDIAIDNIKVTGD